MSGLRSALDELAAVDLSTLTVEELDAELDELNWGIQSMEVLRADRIRENQNRGGHHYFEFPSTTTYLAHRGRMSHGQARRIVALANAADRAPGAYGAWTEQRISTPQAEKLFVLAETVPDEYPEAEEKLIEIIETLSVTDTVKVLEYWRQSVEGPRAADLEVQQLRRGVSLSGLLEGMGRIDGDLTATWRETLNTALNTIIGIPTETDQRSPRQRRHDALEDLARHYLDYGPTPQVGGEKPHLLVLTDLDALQGTAGGTHETLNRGDILDTETIRMLACDASITRILLGPDSEILDVGRKTRVWSPAQRRAITARDRHCVHPNCDRPPDWCDIHHKHHWADGGETSIDSGELLCRYHHILEHVKQALKRGSKHRKT